MDNIILTGFMGTGKTVVGRELAARMDRQHIDTDAVIESEHGPVAAIFAERGEAAFREMEVDVARTLAGRTGMVVSTGGRMMLDNRAARLLCATGRAFCLTAPVAEIIERIVGAGGAGQDGSAGRPLLAATDPAQRIRALLHEREAGYRRFPQVPTDGRTPGEIAEELATLTDGGPVLVDPDSRTPVWVGAAVLGVAARRLGPNPTRVLAESTLVDTYLPLLGVDGDVAVDWGQARGRWREGGTSVVLGGGAFLRSVAASGPPDRPDGSAPVLWCPTDRAGALACRDGGSIARSGDQVVIDVSMLQSGEDADRSGPTPLQHLIEEVLGVLREPGRGM